MIAYQQLDFLNPIALMIERLFNELVDYIFLNFYHFEI